MVIFFHCYSKLKDKIDFLCLLQLCKLLFMWVEAVLTSVDVVKLKMRMLKGLDLIEFISV